MFDMKFLLAVGLLASLAPLLSVRASPETPGADQQQPIALVGGTIHPISGPAVKGTVMFENGMITAIGPRVAIAKGVKQIDVSGKHIYPSLIDAFTNIGLVEINAVRATRDQAEVGQINPNVKANVAFNPDSELIPVTRSNGVLLALTAPTGGLLTGRSSLMKLDGWTYEDMTLKDNVALHINWPRMAPVSDWETEESPAQQGQTRDKALAALNQAFDHARAYRRARQANADYPRDARWEALLPVIDGKLPTLVEADEAQQIQAAVAFCERQGARMILYGGYDALHCAALLRKHEIPVVVAGVYRLPQRRHEDYDGPFTLPTRLRESGLKFCISGAGRFGASNVRNLPYHAATAAAYGLSADEALKAITLYPAQILGVADRVGSLEVGKDATLFISDGDPLETATQIEGAYIQGRRVDLSDRHKRLWKKYQEKYRRQRKLAE